MAAYENRQAIFGSIILGICLLVGLSAAGYFIGKGATRFKSEARIVAVKGLVEREVKSDQAIWTLSMRRAADDLKDAHAKIKADREATLAFLHKQGFTDAEIGREPTRTIDKLAREYGQSQGANQFRYIVMTSLIVKTANVELVRTAVGATEALLESGVVLDGEREGSANPRYVLSQFNDLRPQLLADATKNARSIAEQFASASGAKVGDIRSANQGMIQIFGIDGNDESAPYSPTSTLIKKIRVVSSFEFDLR